jgi:hypothetical protein
MEVRYLWVQQEIRSGRITLGKVAGRDNPTDIATKHVDTETMKRCQASAGLRRWTPSTGIIVALTLLPVAAATNDNDGGVGMCFYITMAFAIIGLGQAGMYLASLAGYICQGGRATRTVGIQTDMEVTWPPPASPRAQKLKEDWARKGYAAHCKACEVGICDGRFCSQSRQNKGLVSRQRFFITQRGDCYHSLENCKGLATRTTELIELGSKPQHLRPCSKCCAASSGDPA